MIFLDTEISQPPNMAKAAFNPLSMATSRKKILEITLKKPERSSHDIQQIYYWERHTFW